MQLLPGNIELSQNPFEKVIWNKLRTELKEDDGILGYKIPSLGLNDSTEIPSFIYRSKQYGIIVIDIVPSKIIKFEDDYEYWVKVDGGEIYSRDYIINNYCNDITNKLSKSIKLYNKKTGNFLFCKDDKPVKSLIIFPDNGSGDFVKCEFISKYLDKNYPVTIKEFIKSCKTNDINQEQIDDIDSILEGTSVFNKKRERISEEKKTRNDLIKSSLLQTFKLDSTQRSVALQVPNGPQRIRGLAGTGKTIILSMKAALTHISNEDFKILFVFNTQSMYNQIKSNIEKYTIEEASKAPDWDRLLVLHAWGGRKKEGLYSFLCSQYGLSPKTLYEARNMSDPYQYIFSDFLSKKKDEIQPIFDMVLIDEAQDFPPAFFETIYYITKEPKRIIWAYDEFQSLNELKISDPETLFGTDKDGNPNMSNDSIKGQYEDGIDKDYMLPNSYRNPRKVLLCAHGLGFGLYSERAKVPMQDKFSWEARGYEIIQPRDKNKFEENDHIVVERPEKYSKNILEKLVDEHSKFSSNDIIKFKNFDTIKQELDSVINTIRYLINNDKIEPEEIVVISLDKSSANSHFNYIRTNLNSYGVLCITPGFVESSDLFKEKGRVTLTTAFRAKGNEANIVFVINSQKAISDSTLRQRNALFVSITRSRGWCYITGNGPDAVKLKKEIDAIDNDYPKFEFDFPSESDYTRRLQIISESDKSLSNKEKTIDDILSEDVTLALLIEKAKGDPETFERLKKLMGI